MSEIITIKKPDPVDVRIGNDECSVYLSDDMDKYLSAIEMWLRSSSDYHSEQVKKGKSISRSYNASFSIAYKSVLEILQSGEVEINHQTSEVKPQ